MIPKFPKRQVLALNRTPASLAQRVGSGATTVPAAIPILSRRYGVDPEPQSQVEQMLEGIECQALSEFLGAVVAEHEVRLALKLALNQGGLTQFRRQGPLALRTSTFARLLQACYITGFWSVHAAERETLFVATFIRGLQELLGSQVVGNTCTASEVMFAIVRAALHRLDDRAPEHSRVLRLMLGWGNEDEVDAVYVPHIRHTMHQALRSVGLIGANRAAPFHRSL